MSAGFLSRILSVCQHQFAWPRRDENGNYYQLCVTCGSKYGYDWTKMRRTARVLNDDPTSDAVATVYHSRHKIAWTPRERRLHHHVPVEFKVRGCEEWQQGISQNVSHSGLLLKCAMPLVEGQSLELKLEMPSELTGETPAQVLCRGLVARVTELPATAKNPREFLAGCSIVDYEFASKRPSRAVVQTINIVTLKKRHYIG